MWKIIEWTEDQGHPLECKWEPLWASNYDIILGKDILSDFIKSENIRIRFRVSDVHPGEDYKEQPSTRMTKILEEKRNEIRPARGQPIIPDLYGKVYPNLTATELAKLIDCEDCEILSCDPSKDECRILPPEKRSSQNTSEERRLEK